nr:retrovirus-related Pol polyprotein from transposon TNT 1-94 [Tanacetum cinerariifolium]
MKSVIKCKTAKEMWNDLILAYEGPYDIIDTKIAALRLKFNAFKSFEGEEVNGTFTSVKALVGKGTRKEKISSKEVVFTKADESLSMLAPEITFDLESKCDSQEPLLRLSKLIGAALSGTSEMSPAYVIKEKIEKSPTVPKPRSDKKANSSTEQLLLTLMEEVKGLKKIPSGVLPSNSQPCSSIATKQKTCFGPCKHYGFKNHLSDDCYSKPKCSTCISTDHLTKEHLEHAAIKKTLRKLKAQSPLKPSPKKAPMIPKPFKECKYYGFNDHHSDHCEVYPACEVSGSIAHEPSDCPKKQPNSIRPNIANRKSEPTDKWESGPKVVFGDDSLGDTEGYGSLNYNGITFTMVAYVNGLKHNLININKKYSACEKGKHHRASFKTKSFSINKSLHLLHMDLFGTVKGQTISHNKYTLVIVDEYSRKGDAINFNENRPFPDDEFLEPRSEVTKCTDNTDYFPNIPIHENTTPSESPILQ